MRLWHYKLIPVLPTKMLVSEWRECIAIKRQWESGTLKHRLVFYVTKHQKYYFYKYLVLVVEEMMKRKIKFNLKLIDEISDFCQTNIADLKIKYDENLHYPEHNNRYLLQCYYNLQEKFDRGIISEEEWDKIADIV